MKRRGYILLEALIALFLIASLSAALYPFAAEAVRAVDLMAKRSRIAGEGLYAMDFMTEQLRNTLKRGEASSISGDTYSYYAYDKWGEEETYRFFLDQEKLKLDVYGRTTEPVTGTTSGEGRVRTDLRGGAALCQEWRGRACDLLLDPASPVGGNDAFPDESSLVCRFLQEGAAL